VDSNDWLAKKSIEGRIKDSTQNYIDGKHMRLSRTADKKIDAVIISTLTIGTQAQMKWLAGKDIYLQKPASLTIAEGRR
jgi:hypothetical protein